MRLYDDIDQRNFIYSELISAGIEIEDDVVTIINKITLEDILEFSKIFFVEKNFCFIEMK